MSKRGEPEQTVCIELGHGGHLDVKDYPDGFLDLKVRSTAHVEEVLCELEAVTEAVRGRAIHQIAREEMRNAS